MKRLVATVLFATLVSGCVVAERPADTYQQAQNDGRNDRNSDDRNRFAQNERADRNDRNDRGNNPGAQRGAPRWARGDRLPAEYQHERYYVSDWRERNLRQPPSGHRWVRNDNNDLFLVLIATGIVVEVILR
jgi:Ni/Co efflux regulator RcnB